MSSADSLIDTQVSTWLDHWARGHDKDLHMDSSDGHIFS